MKKLITITIAAVIFGIASYNVYNFFQEKQRIKAEKHAQKIALVEAQRKQKLEAQRQAEIEHQTKLNEIALAKARTEAELLEKKIEQQKRIEQYELLKNAKKAAREDELLQRRISNARKINNYEGLPGNSIDGIKGATYLNIRNNPLDYTGNYKPNSILKLGKLTTGGADGLMLFAMVAENLKSINEMIAIGHDINARNKAGYTPLMFASAYNTPEVISFLIQQGANTNSTEDLTQGNSMHVSARFNPMPETIEQLVKQGMDINATDKDGNTPLLIASQFNQNLQVVEKLIELGADITAANHTGNVAYTYVYERLKLKYPMGKFKSISKDYETDVLALLEL